jgi:hypothetical protein
MLLDLLRTQQNIRNFHYDTSTAKAELAMKECVLYISSNRKITPDAPRLKLPGSNWPYQKELCSRSLGGRLIRLSFPCNMQDALCYSTLNFDGTSVLDVATPVLTLFSVSLLQPY